jgi:threonyl-tRNA synthetase
MQKKIRNAQSEKVPYMLVVGDREAAEGTVAVRLRSGKDLGAMPIERSLHASGTRQRAVATAPTERGAP